MGILKGSILTNTDKSRVLEGDLHVSADVLKTNKMGYLIKGRMESDEDTSDDDLSYEDTSDYYLSEDESESKSESKSESRPSPGDIIRETLTAMDPMELRIMAEESLGVPRTKDIPIPELIRKLIMQQYRNISSFINLPIDILVTLIKTNPQLILAQPELLSESIHGKRSEKDVEKIVNLLDGYILSQYKSRFPDYFKKLSPKIQGIVDQRIEKFEKLRLWIKKRGRKNYTSKQLSALTKLYLYGIGLTEVPAEIGQLSNLQELALNDNKLTAVPVEIGNLSNLQELHLSNNQLTAIPAGIENLSNLQELNLYGNRLTAVPAKIGQLRALQRLYLYHNNLPEIPAEIGQLSNLQELYLSDNGLTAVPAKIGQLSNLRVLFLHKNQLTEIPAEIGQLLKLEVLDLDHNQLPAIPAEIGQLSNLQELDLSDNPKLKISQQLLQKLKQKLGDGLKLNIS